MSLILTIETSETSCSVALGNKGIVVDELLLDNAKSHSSQLTLLIDKILKKNNIEFKNLSAVAVSKGPGSYTGLRIGVSTAKGICYALNIPLIAIGTLEALCEGVNENIHLNSSQLPVLLCPMIDARRNEVYCRIFDKNKNALTEIEAKIISSNSFNELLKNNLILFFGSGSIKARSLITNDNATFLTDIFPRASYLVKKSFQCYNNSEFVDVAYFEPFYLKDFIATTSKKKLF